MKTVKNILKLSLLSTALSASALAYKPIIRDFHSVAAAGMGDVRYSTGTFEQNFFANPARSTENGSNLLQLPKLSFETSSGTIGSISSLIKSGNGLQTFQDAVGEPLSARAQLVFPAFYKNHFLTDNWSMGLGAFLSAQTIPVLSQSGSIDPNTLMSAGPVFNLSRRLLEENRLSVGMNVRAEVRASSASQFSVQDFLTGTNLSSKLTGGSGFGMDMDLGASFRPHWTLGHFQYEVDVAVNNLLGGKYTNIGKPVASWSSDPFATKTSFNFGLSARKEQVGFLNSLLLAIETTDIGNNTNGSFYRTLHMGAEADWKVFRFRTGLNQGYITGGFGIDLLFLSLNLATYGEEMGLIPGTLEDRRYALELGFQI
jgi:hypothetical protein